MINSGPKKNFVVSVCLAILVAFFVCPFFTTNISSDVSMSGHENSSHSNPITHASHLKEMTSASFVKISLTNMLSLLSLILIAVISVVLIRKVNLHLPSLTSPYISYYRKRDSLYQAKKTIYSWLSLFERAPNFIRTT